MESFQHRFSQTGEFLSKVDKQHDIRKVVEGLARQIEVLQNGTHPEGTSSGSNAAPLLEIEDLKRKVARLLNRPNILRT